MDFFNQNFKDAREVLDGNSYKGCTFTNCKIIYRGGSGPSINDCKFNECTWHFEDAAERTVGFMHQVYHGMGDGGIALIDSLITVIRNPK